MITKQLVALTFAVLISKQQQRGGVTERQLELRSVHDHVGCNHATQSISQNYIYESVGSRNESSLNFIFLPTPASPTDEDEHVASCPLFLV